MLAVLLLPAAILLSLRLLHYIFVPPRDRLELGEHALRLQHQLRSSGLILLAAGVIASIWIYRDADPNALDTTNVISYEMGPGYTIPIHAADSKKYSRELEKIGGKLGNNISASFHGRSLAYLLFAFSLASCLGCLAGARAVTVTHYDGESDGGRGDQPVSPDPAPPPPSRAVRWTLKFTRRARRARRDLV